MHVQDNAVRDAFRIGDSIDDRMGPEGRRSRYNTASDVTLEKKKKKRAAEEEQEEAEEDKPKKKVKKSPKVHPSALPSHTAPPCTAFVTVGMTPR